MNTLEALTMIEGESRNSAEAGDPVQRVFLEIATERQRQRALHPEGGDLDLFVMLAIIGEEFGEAQKAALNHLLATGRGDAIGARESSVHLRMELVQLAATAVKALEHYDARRLAIYGDQLPLSPTHTGEPLFADAPLEGLS